MHKMFDKGYELYDAKRMMDVKKMKEIDLDIMGIMHPELNDQSYNPNNEDLHFVEPRQDNENLHFVEQKQDNEKNETRDKYDKP